MNQTLDRKFFGITFSLLVGSMLLAPLTKLHAVSSQPSAAQTKSRWNFALGHTKQTNSIDYYVATDGADTHPGTREQPFAMLEGARDAIRKLKIQPGGLPAGQHLLSMRYVWLVSLYGLS